MTADESDYDRYFGILREPERTRTAHLRTYLLGDLPHTGLDEGLRTTLVTGLRLASRTVETQPLALFDTAPVSGLPCALRRWKLGHQALHLLLTAMNLDLDSCLSAAQGAVWHRLADSMAEVCLLYDAATAAMEYAADFPVTAYRDEIRPTMEPPHMPAGFSGVFNRDHRAMVRRSRHLERAVRELPRDASVPESVRRGAAALRAARRRNRRHHGRICERCVPGGASLLRAHLAQHPVREGSPCDTG
ncbi:hypothetical protein [Streptomyces sp. UNOC14_S4]|uniref:hypothetical protein n=1 Tax=Streptomyces sp. UNOC14_S4 TaxID=2872340 RepID=UPI001E37D765|nr:hypothetical protein [Streptomyces sp. UNOC14_S4]MCC3766186.1 hypothetical protein [Streptomyces sp. UNOC14_S4]